MKTKLYFIIVLLFAALCVSGQTTLNYTVILRSNVGMDTMWDGVSMRVFGLTPGLSAPVKVPALVLYCNEGDSVVLDARSISQNEHHTIHLHGLDVDTRNDGDPSTSFWLQHMQDTTYSFKANNAGTYLYHCHVADVVHVQMGMYGMIVVRAAGGVNTAWTGGPAFSQDYNWLMAEYDRSWHDTILYHDPIEDTIHIPPYTPDYFLVNGHSQQELLTDDSTHITGSVNEPIYLRLGNIGYCNNKIIFPASLNAQIIDSDGRPLPIAVNSDTLEIAPGERYGVMLMPSVEFNGTIEVRYESMNTGLVLQSEFPPVDIVGYYGIQETPDNNTLTVYPNPARENFRISFAEALSDDATFELLDVSGRSIMAQPLSAGTRTQLIEPSVSAGIYFVRITTTKGIYFQKINLLQS
jgi:FtsP/CotA-like multicopper oxidase with cupredoxin domain